MKNDNDLPPSSAGRSESPASPCDAATTASLAQAARCLHKNSRLSPIGLTPETALMRDLEDSFATSDDADMMLYTQARILDAMFNHFMTEEIHSYTLNLDTGVRHDYIRTSALEIALRLQQHARTTLRALSLSRRKTRKEPK